MGINIVYGHSRKEGKSSFVFRTMLFMPKVFCLSTVDPARANRSENRSPLSPRILPRELCYESKLWLAVQSTNVYNCVKHAGDSELEVEDDAHSALEVKNVIIRGFAEVQLCEWVYFKTSQNNRQEVSQQKRTIVYF